MANAHEIASAASAAASSPAFIISSVGTTLTGISQWLSTGPGLATAFGVLLTAMSFGFQVWLGVRDDRRKQRAADAEEREREARLRSLGPPAPS